MSGSLGSLVVSLAANTAEFTADLGKAAHEAAKRMDQISRAAAQASKAVGLAFVAGVGASVVLVKQAIDAADSLGKLAVGAGLSVKAFSELNYAAGLAGVSTEALSTSITRLNRNISDTAAGTGEARDAFQALGIDVRNADGTLKNADQVLLEVADRFAGMEDGATKASFATMLFGRAGAAMIPMLNDGSAGILRLREEAQQLGATLDGSASNAAAAFNDNLTRLNQVKKGLANQIMVAVLPALNQLTDGLVDSAKKAGAMDEAARIAANGVRIFLTSIIAVTAAVRVAGDSVGKLAAVFASFPTPDLTKIRSPVTALVDIFRGKDFGQVKNALSILKEDSADMASVIENAVGRVNNVWKEQAIAAAAATNSNKKNYDQELAAIAAREAAQKSAGAAARDHAKAVQAAIDADIAQGEHMAEMFAAAEENQQRQAELKSASSKDNISRIRKELLNEQELLAMNHQEKIEQLKEARELELLTESEYNEMIVDLERDHMQRLTDIRKSKLTDLEKFTALSFRKQATTIVGMMADMTAGVAGQSRALFELNKVAGIANVALNSIESISNAYKFGTAFGGPVAGAAMAALAGVATLAQINAIRSTQFGGGGNAPSIAGSTAATPVTPVGSGAPDSNRQTTVINLQGETFGRKQVRALLEALNEEGRSGGRLVIA